MILETTINLHNKTKEELILFIQEAQEIVKKQSYTNKKMRKKLQGYRKLLKLKEKHLCKKDRFIDFIVEDIRRRSIDIILSHEDLLQEYKEKFKKVDG